MHDVTHDRVDVGRPPGGVPAEIQQLPALLGAAQVTVLVECAGVGAEVELAAMAFEPQAHLGKPDVCTGDDPTALVGDRALPYNRAE